MRTIEVNIYKFNELSQKAKDYAVAVSYSMHYHNGDEARKSLKAFIEAFGGQLHSASIDFSDPSQNDYTIKSLALDPIEIACVLSKLGTFNPVTYEGLGDCKLTGVYTDELLLDGFRKAFFNGCHSLKELFQAGITTWETNMRMDYQYYYSEESLASNAEANKWEYYEDGSMF